MVIRMAIATTTIIIVTIIKAAMDKAMKMTTILIIMDIAMKTRNFVDVLTFRMLPDSRVWYF